VGRINGVLDGMGVFVGFGVPDGTISCPGPVVGVQVGGSAILVGVEEGTKTMGASVAGGNGFIGPVGDEKIDPTNKANPTMARIKRIDNKSHIENFILILFE
jgi:hypothetical protein